jgi:phosphatidylethanolamine-binding protein (PEBP) family uncharacterized protein
MRPLRKAISGAVLVSALALAGCGSSGSNPRTDAVVVVPFKSAAIAGTSLPARYTCDGKDVAPPLEWGTVPSGTRELVLSAVGLKPGKTAKTYQVSVEWAIAGVNPKLHSIGAGELPSGAHIGVASDGKRHYSICPKKGVNEQFRFMLYAVPAVATVSPHFAALPILSALSKPNAETSATGVGAFAVTYRRT